MLFRLNIFTSIFIFLTAVTCKQIEPNQLLQTSSLDAFRVSLPSKSINWCDTILIENFSRKSHVSGVVKFDYVPLWRDITKRDVIDSLRFADTVTVESTYHIINQANEEYYKLRGNKTCEHFYTASSNIKRIHDGVNSLPGLYFIAARSNAKEDSVFAKKIIRLLERKYFKDTIRIDHEGGTDVYTGNTASLSLQLLLLRDKKQFKDEFSIGGKLIRYAPKLSKHKAINQILGIINRNLIDRAITNADIKICYAFLKEIINKYENVPIAEFEFNTWIDIEAASIIMRHSELFSKLYSADEIIDILLNSKNEAVHLLGVQMQTTMFIRTDNIEQATNTILKEWKKYPNVYRSFFKDDVLLSLVPTAISIDSLLAKAHDYEKTRSFIQQLQEGLSKRDSTLFNFLEEKKFQLCFESVCAEYDPSDNKKFVQSNRWMGSHYSFYGYAFREAIKQKTSNANEIDILVKKGAVLRDGLIGMKVRTSIESAIAKKVCDYAKSSKVQIGNEVFWVNQSEIEMQPRALFKKLQPEKAELISDPIVTEIIPMPNWGDCQIKDINSDNIPDFIGMKTVEFAIDGRDMSTIWKSSRSNLQRYNTFFANDMYVEFERHNGLSKRSIRNDDIWIMSEKIPQIYGMIMYPVCKHGDRAFLLTTNGYLLQLNDKDGLWTDLFRFNGWISSVKQDRKDLYFVVNEVKSKKSTLYVLDLDLRNISLLHQFESDYEKLVGGKMEVDKGVIFLNVGKKIIAIEKRNGNIFNEYIETGESNFTIVGDYLVTVRSAGIKVINVKRPNMCWETKIPEISTNAVVKGNILYVCNRTDLFLLSFTTGEKLKKLKLPLELNHSAGIKYYADKLLLSSQNRLIVIENK